MDEKKLIARWESRGKKYWVELYQDALGYFYHRDGSLGNLGSCSLEQALAAGAKQASFAPSKCKRIL